MGTTSFSGPLVVGPETAPLASIDQNGNITGMSENMGINVVRPAGLGGSGFYSRFSASVGAIADSAATTILTITCPNVNASALLELTVHSTITNSGHTYDSTRVVKYLCSVTRVAGAALVAVLSAAIGAQIATSSGGQTLTTTLSAAAVSGGVTATNTIALQITNVNGSAGTTQTSVICEIYNLAAGGVTI